MNIETLVHEEVQDRLEQMHPMEPTEEGYKARADVTLKFIDRAIKMNEQEVQAKLAELKAKELELHEKEVENQTQANKLKEAELEESRKNRVVDSVIQVLKIVVPPTVALIGAIGLTNYERTDSVTSTAGREIWKKVFRMT